MNPFRLAQTHLRSLFGFGGETAGALSITSPGMPSAIQPPAKLRELSRNEREFLTALLNWSEEKGSPFLPQVPTLAVTSQCSCGCPSIGIYGNETLRVQDAAHYNCILDAFGTSNGAMVGIMLFQAGGMLTGLEVHALGDEPKPFPLPDVNSLQALE